MEELHQDICQSIVKIVPTLSSDIVKKAADDLIQNGIQSMDKLGLVESTDLVQSGIPLYNAREVVLKWKKLQTTTQQSQPGTSQGTENLQPARMRYSNFTVDYTKFASDTSEIIKRGEILTERQANTLVATIVNEVRLTVPSATRNIFNGISRDMINDHPNTFKEFLGKENSIVPFRLKYKLENAFDNRKRNKGSRTQAEIEAPARPEAFGCKRWQVTSLPTGETEITLNEKKAQLQAIFDNVSSKEWNWTEILDFMEKTYGMQRAAINAQVPPKKSRKTKGNQPPFTAKTTDEIEMEFPFLFVYKGLVQHFHILTGIDIQKKFQEFQLDPKFDNMIAYLEKQGTKNEKTKRKMDRALKQNDGNPKLIAFVKMINHALKENSDDIFKVIEPTVKYSELQDHVPNIPGTPCIYIKGQSEFKAKRYYLTVDGSPRALVKNFEEAIIWSVCTFFVLNLKYPESAANTFDFIQRSILDINPDKGSKIPATIRRKGPITFTLATLAAGMAKYNTMCIEEAAEDIDDPESAEDN